MTGSDATSYNFARGSCCFGSECKYVHVLNAKSTVNNDSSKLGNNTEAMLVKLLDKLGLRDKVVNNSSMGHNNSPTQPPTIIAPHVDPTANHKYTGSGPAYYTPSAQPHNGTTVRPPPGFVYMHGLVYYISLALAQHSGPVYLVVQPASHAQSRSITLWSIGPTVTPGQEPALPHVFTAKTLHDPTTGAWNMDTCASSHLNASVTNLNNVFNTCIYPSIVVGDEHSIPVTNTGHSILPTPFRSLHLNNILVTPHIVKNVIFVRQFVRDNNCIIEFDAFGFSVKNFMTRRVLLRCDSSGDLYPITAPSPIPHAFLVSQ
ncbi:ribonuclease H-like domain-containing protein, partial [Tanacetum coccineum]